MDTINNPEMTVDTIEPKAERRRRYAKQFMMATASGLSAFSAGYSLLWANVLASNMENKNSTSNIFGSDIYLANWQKDLVVSVCYIGSLFGYLAAGYLVFRIGRRSSLAISVIPGIMGSMLITLAINAPMIIAGRFLDGFMAGLVSVAGNTYVIEISDLKIRGSIYVVITMLFQSGGLVVVLLGMVITWYYMALMNGCLLLIYCFVLMPLLPESPAYLAIKNRNEQALKVLQQLRGPYSDNNKELTLLQTENQRDCKILGYKGLLKKDYIKKMAIIGGVFIVDNFCGTLVLRVNAMRQLQTLGLTYFDDKVSTVIVASLLLIGTLILTCVVDRIGRRRCLIISLFMVAIAYITLGTCTFLTDTKKQMNETETVTLQTETNTTMIGEENISHTVKSKLQWISIGCLMLAAFGQSIGIGPLPFLLAPEMFPTSVRSQAIGVCTMMFSLQAFTVLQLFSPMLTALTPAGLYWFYAAVALIGIPYIYFLISETSGRRVG